MKTTKGQIIICLLFITLSVLSTDLFAQYGGFNVGSANSAIQQNVNYIKTWANWIVGVAFFIGCIFSTWALMTNNPNAKGYVIGTIVALVFWGVINQIVQ